MNYFQAIILGIIEGITEFLPISSTGHLILGSSLLNIPPDEFQKSFEIAIQLGAILAVVVLYAKTLILNVEIIKRVIVAFIPTGILGFIFYQMVKVFLESRELVLWALLIGGLLLIVFEYWHQEHPEAHEDLATIPYGKSLAIGSFQALAMVPGVSRAAATILGGLLVGLRRKTIVEFSFLLAIPTMLAATGYDLYKNGSSFSSDQFQVLVVGFVVSFVVAVFAIKFLLAFIKNHSFIGFGIYRILLVLAFWFFIMSS